MHKEFWIDDILNVDRPNQKTAYIHEQDVEKCHRAIHVIEISAYETIKHQLTGASINIDQLRAELKTAQEKLKVAEDNIDTAIKMINHHIVASGGSNHGSLHSAIRSLKKIRGGG